MTGHCSSAAYDLLLGNAILPTFTGEETGTRAASNCPESHSWHTAELRREDRHSSKVNPLQLPQGEYHPARYCHWLGTHWFFTHNIQMDSYHSSASKWEGQGDGGGRALQPWAATPFLCLLQPLPRALLLTQATQGWRAEGITATMPPLLQRQPTPPPQNPKPIVGDPNFVANSNSQLQTSEHHLQSHLRFWAPLKRARSFGVSPTSIILAPAKSCMMRPEVTMGEMPSSISVP